MNDPVSIPAHIVGGPIEMRDYDHITLAVDHTMVLPDGTTQQVPAGTRLIMNTGTGGTGIRYENGLASRGRAADYPASPEA